MRYLFLLFFLLIETKEEKFFEKKLKILCAHSIVFFEEEAEIQFKKKLKKKLLEILIYLAINKLEFFNLEYIHICFVHDLKNVK